MAKYSYVDRFWNNRALVKVKGKWGYIDENNVEVIAPQYDDAFPFETDEFTFVKKGDFWGGIDINGNIILPFEYEDLTSFYNDWIYYGASYRVRHDGKYGYIGAYGDVDIPFIYDYIADFNFGDAVIVGLAGKYGVYSVDDGEVISPIYATPESAWDAFGNIDHPEECEYNINGDRRVYDITTGGDVWIPPIYEFNFLHSCTHGYFTDDMLAVCVNNKYGIINKHLVEVVPIRYDSIGYFRDGVADVRIHNRTGYINKKGEMRVKDGDQEAWIPTKYEWGDDFHEGLAAVLLNYKWGFINRDGEEVIPLVYEEVLAPGFCNGMATVMLNGEWVKIDVNGNVIQE